MPSKIFDVKPPVYKPSFDIYEDMAIDIGDRKLTEKLNVIINFDVVEKTKSFTILRINSIHMLPSSKRRY